VDGHFTISKGALLKQHWDMFLSPQGVFVFLRPKKPQSKHTPWAMVPTANFRNLIRDH
jgi:hypothetical protein